MTARREKVASSNASPVKYCSERCRRSKPGKVDRQIEDAFAALLRSDTDSYRAKYALDEEPPLQDSGKMKKSKGDPRVIVWCSDVESLVFGSRYDPEKTAGRKKNRVPRGVPDAAEWKSVDMEDERPKYDVDSDESYESEEFEEFETSRGVILPVGEDVDRDHLHFGAGKRRPSQTKAEVNGSVGGEKGWAEKIEETDEMLQKRREGQKRAEERELVRRAARRGVAFGFKVDEIPQAKVESGKRKKGGKDKRVLDDSAEEAVNKDFRRKCEAVITKAAVVVEPSFAKGDWGIRWRDDHQL